VNTPTLAAPGIVLRPLEFADAAALFVALGDAEVQFYRRAAPHGDVEETARYIQETLASGFGWAITESGGEALGRLALRLIEGDAGEFGIVLRRAAHRRGLAAKALALAEEFAFTQLNLRALRAEIDAANDASLALFARARFVREPLSRSAATHRGVREHIIMRKRHHANFRTAS
jgi:ribosomal-protein-alanine N-acetyltransferase